MFHENWGFPVQHLNLKLSCKCSVKVQKTIIKQKQKIFQSQSHDQRIPELIRLLRSVGVNYLHYEIFCIFPLELTLFSVNLRGKMQRTTQKFQVVCGHISSLLVHFGLIYRIIVFLSGQHLLKKSTTINTDTLRKIYSDVLFGKQELHVIQTSVLD